MHLTHIYQRPETSVMVTIQEDACLILGRTALPAYLLKIYALPCFIAPVTNLRNTVLLQNALHDLLRIPPEHGVIIFMPVAEENLATNGSTVRGEIARLERSDQEDSPSLFKTISRTMSRRRLKTSSGQSQPTTLPTSPLPHLPVYQSPPLTEPVQQEDQPEGPARSEDRSTRFLRMRDSMKSLVYHRLMEAIEKCEREKKEAKDTPEAKEGKGVKEPKRGRTGKLGSDNIENLQCESRKGENSKADRKSKDRKSGDEKQEDQSTVDH